MNRLILVKHSLPEIDTRVPASRWHLSAEGKRRAGLLAEVLAPHAVDEIVSSQEPKAEETARISAGILSVPVRTLPGLHEHLRETVAFEGKEQFEAKVRKFFDNPQTLVFGEETADQAHRRFEQAVRAIMLEKPLQSTVIVAHGTVISLFVSRASDRDGYSLWKQLGLPSCVILSLPELKIQELTAEII